MLSHLFSKIISLLKERRRDRKKYAKSGKVDEAGTAVANASLSTVEILSRTPGTLNRRLRDLPEPWVLSNEGLDTWNAFDILGHLIHGEESHRIN